MNDSASPEIYPWKAWRVRNPKGRIGALLACAIVWWPFYTVVLLALLEALAVLRFYQEWVEKGAWAK